jgi:hypothetical protein
VILAKRNQPLVYWNVLESWIKEQALVLQLELRCAVDDAFPLKVKRRIEKDLVRNQIPNHFVEIRPIHVLV